MTVTHLVGGRRILGESGRVVDVIEPATGLVIASTPLASDEEAHKAVEAAHEAFADWSEMPPPQRAQIMFRYRDLLIRHEEELARSVSREQGKLLDDAKGSLRRGIDVVEFSCGAPHLLKGESSDNVAAGLDVQSIRQPLGVVVGISPFNFPEMVPLCMLAPALAFGNTVVLKPSEKAPTCPVLLAELFLEAGGPTGVFNVLHGDAATAEALICDEKTKLVSFIGSTPVARRVYSLAATHGKRVQAMGGAKNHLIVAPDAPLDATVQAIVAAAFGSAGERCMAVSVVVAVGEATADAVVAKLSKSIAQLRVETSLSEGGHMGPLVSAVHKDRVSSYIDQGVADGAVLVVDGRTRAAELEPNGFFLGGTLFDRVSTDMSVYRDEIFGPVLCVVRVDTLADALAIVNSNTFGNGAAIFTASGRTAREFTRRVDAGMVGVNVSIPVPVGFHSFGGWRASSFGGHNMYGSESVKLFTKLKTVSTRWIEATDGRTSFAMTSESRANKPSQ